MQFLPYTTIYHFYLISFIVLLASSTHCSVFPATNKFCEIQEKNCDDNPHPLCSTFRPNLLPNDLENAVFYELNETDINFILTNVNWVRSNIANGYIKGYKSAANLRIVKWSTDYVRLGEMKLKHVGVCTKISLNDDVELEMEQFRGNEDAWDRYFYQPYFRTRCYDDSYGPSRWMAMFRAEFDMIGCVLYHDVDGETNMFECFTNKAGGKENSYRVGKPCSQCDNGCDKFWTSLCDTIDTNSSPSDYQITTIFVLLCITMAIIFLAGMVFIFRLVINKTLDDLQMTDKMDMVTDVLYSQRSEPDGDSHINFAPT